jgi:hypothetical protein
LGIDLPVREFRPGDTIHLGVYQAAEAVSVQMVHTSGLVLAERLSLPGAGNGITRSDVPIQITAATPGGEYVLMSGPARLATVSVTHSDPLWRDQDVPIRLSANFGDAIELIGYDLTPRQPRPGDSVTVDLYWRARAPVQNVYTVFVQIVGPFNPVGNNPLWGQQDNPPVSGTFPTSDWPVGMIVRDRHVLKLDPSAPPADYSLIAGLYDPRTGTRLPVPDHPDNAVQLQSFKIP